MRFVRELPRKFYGALPLLYVMWAGPFVAMLLWLIPPFQNPDERNHYLRAVQIARGELVGYRLPQGALPNARKLLLCWGDRGVDAATREKTNTSEVEGRLEDRLQGLDAKLPLPALRQPPSDIAGSRQQSICDAGGNSDPAVVAASNPFNHLEMGDAQQRVHKSDFQAGHAQRFWQQRRNRLRKYSYISADSIPPQRSVCLDRASNKNDSPKRIVSFESGQRRFRHGDYRFSTTSCATNSVGYRCSCDIAHDFEVLFPRQVRMR